MEELIREYGYWIVFFGSLIEGESVILAASAAAYHGYLSLSKVILVAFVGTLCADQFFFQIGRRYGKAIFKKFPKLEAPAGKAFGLLHKYDTLFILSFRFIYGIRNVSPIVVGMSGISTLRFTVLNIIAAAIWSLLSCMLGYYGGEFFEILLPIILEHKLSAILIMCSLVFLIVFGMMKARSRLSSKAN